MKKVVIGIIVVALIAGGWFAWSRFRAGQRVTAMNNLQTVSVERGGLLSTVGATGTVRSNQSALLSWQTSGSVEEVYADVGQLVKSGEVLADLKETSLSQNIILAGVELVDAKNALKDLIEPASELALKQAEQTIAKAQEAVRDLERRLNSLNSPSTGPDIDQARSSVVLAKNRLDEAREAFEPYANKPEDNLARAALQSQLAQAQKAYDAAVQRLNNLLGTANDIDRAVAEADLALAKAQLSDAQENYQTLIEGPDSEDIAAAEARIAAAQAAVDLKHIVAPFDSTITEVKVKPGDQVFPGTTAFRLDDLSKLLVDVQVSEVDINNIKERQDVILTFDAIPAKEYHGTVSQVGLVSTPVQGVVDYTVTVELTDADEDVKPGMTAAVNIVVEQLEDVLLVPNRAVRVNEGQRVVYVLRKSAPEPVKITLGASSETSSEVLEGDLQAGDQVILNPPVEFDQNGPPPFVQQR